MPTVIGAKELKARLAASPAGAYLFFGEEEHLKRVYLARFRALVRENAEFNVTTVTVREDDALSTLRAEMDRMPFLSELRFLEVRGLSLHKFSNKEASEFCALLATCPEDLILILYFFECDIPFSGNIPKTQKRLSTLPAYQNLPDSVTVVHFAHPTTAELTAYYEAKFKSRGVSVTKEVAALFAARGGGNMTLLENESEKLIALAASTGGALTREMVDEAMPELSESMIYKLSDALEACDAPRAITEYRILRSMKFDTIPLLASVARTVSNLTLMKGEITDKEAESRFGIKAFRARSLRERARRMDAGSLFRCQERCSQIDRELKNTSLDADVLLETLIVELCRTLGGLA